ncbi:MAG TPA: ABC transporter permease [Mycobacteriales bacterium]|nr:ABC transporter permease [Mycobacteriales bacterium]
MSRLDHSPRAGAAPVARMLRAQTVMELRLTLRRGESLLLTMVIPIVLLAFFASVDLLETGADDPLDFLVPGVLALAVMSTSMTGLAIATGFERSYGVLKRLGASPLPRGVLLTAKTLGVLVVESLQTVLLCGVGLALGWRPSGGVRAAGATVVLVLLGTACFCGIGLLMAGTLRAEATLAAANGLYLVLLLLGGVLFPLSQLPGPLRAVGEVLPTAALSDGLRAALADSGSLSARPVAVLAVWAVVSLGLASVTFRWE